VLGIAVAGVTGHSVAFYENTPRISPSPSHGRQSVGKVCADCDAIPSV